MILRLPEGLIVKCMGIKAMTELKQRVNNRLYRVLAEGGKNPNLIRVETTGFNSYAIGGLTTTQITDLLSKVIDDGGRVDLTKEIPNCVICYDEQQIPDSGVYLLLENNLLGLNSQVNSYPPMVYSSEGYDEDDEYEEDDEDWDEV